MALGLALLHHGPRPDNLQLLHVHRRRVPLNCSVRRKVGNA